MQMTTERYASMTRELLCKIIYNISVFACMLSTEAHAEEQYKKKPLFCLDGLQDGVRAHCKGWIVAETSIVLCTLDDHWATCPHQT